MTVSRTSHKPRALTRRSLAAACLSACVALTLAACGTTEDPVTSSGPKSTPKQSSDEKITLVDARGKEVVLDGPAERVVALEWSEVEDLVTLGVMPVGVADVKGYSTWVKSAPLDDSVQDVGTRQEPSVDAVVSLQPDLVIMEGGRGLPIEQLEKTAPVLVIKGSDSTRNIEQMKHNFTLIAQAVGKEDTAKQILSEFDAKLADAKEQIAAAGLAGAGFAMADGWMEGSQVSIRMFAKGSLVSDLAEAIGLVNAWPEKGDAEWGLGVTDVEGLIRLGDVHFFYSASEDDVFAGKEGLANNAIWKSLPFVKAGQVHKLEDGTWTFGGPRSCMHIVDQFVRTLTT